MDKIVHSLKKFKFTKEIYELLSSMGPFLNPGKNIHTILIELFKKDFIGETELMAIKTKFMLNEFARLLERNANGIDCGIYLYDDKEKTLWNGASSNVEAGYNEYSHGLCAVNDISKGDHIPLYCKQIISVPDVEKGEDIVSLNHKKELLASGYHSYSCSPLHYRDTMIGHIVLYSKQKNSFSSEELDRLLRYNSLIEGKLAEMKNHLLSVIKTSH